MVLILVIQIAALFLQSALSSVILPDYYLNTTTVYNLTLALKNLTTNNSTDNTRIPINDVELAYQNCKKGSDLTIDASAAIYLYTSAGPCYKFVNAVLRSLNATQIAPWKAYLKLLHITIERFPLVTTEVCRGDTYHLYLSHRVNSTVYLPSLSFTEDEYLCNVYSNLGTPNCTKLYVKTVSARSVVAYSAFLDAEKEYIILPGTKVKIVSITEQTAQQCRIVKVEEIQPQPLHLTNITNLGDQITAAQAVRYDDFLRNYYEQANITRLNSTSLFITVIGGVGNPFTNWPIIVSVMNGQVQVSGTQLIGGILIGINQYPTRGLTNREIKSLITNTTIVSHGKWLSAYYITPPS